MKKKVIFVTQALWIGGIETALVNLLNHLDPEKYDLTCLITEDYQQMAKDITVPCRLLVADRHHTVSFQDPYPFVRLYDLTEKPQTNSKFRLFIWKVLCLLLRSAEMKLYGRYLKKQLQGEHFDTAVIYSDRVAELAVRAVNADKYQMFYHNGGIGRAYHDHYGYRACEKIVAVSHTQCEKLKKLRPRYAKKMIVIPNYIDVEAIHTKAVQKTDTLIFTEDGIHLVSCGRLALEKGFDIAIKACAQLVAKGYSNLHWHILGAGPDKAYLEQLAKQHGVSEHFHLLGAKANPFPYMQAADLYVQPSRFEGYSLSILEARVLACPTVATYAAAEEQLTDGITGTLCDTSADALVLAIEKHLQNPQLSLQYRQALSAYSFDNANREILDRIEALL